MDSSSQPPTTSPSTALAMPPSSPAATPLSSSVSILSWPHPTDGGHAFFNPNNTHLLQPSSDAVSAASVAAIVSLSHTHQVITLKLTNTNYLYWRMQMKPYFLGQGAFGFVDGSNSCPSPYVLAADGTSFRVNQLVLHWKQQDQIILSSLFSSLSMEVLHLVVDCQTSYSVWRTLEQALASTSNSRIMQPHDSLQDLRQGDESVTQFMQKAKALFDELVAADRPFLWQISTYMCFVAFEESLRT